MLKKDAAKTSGQVTNDTRDKLLADLVEQFHLNRKAQAALLDLLIKLDRRLNPRPDFYPMRQDLAIGASWTFDPGMQPEMWFVSLDPTSSAAKLAISATQAGMVWLELSPGAHVKFPARYQTLTVIKTGSGVARTTIVALGDVAFDYATQ